MTQDAKKKAAAMHEATDIGTKLTEARRRVLAEIDDLAQGARIARRLGLPVERVRTHMQWARRNGLAMYDRSRWFTTPAGSALLRSLQENQT